MEGWLAWLAVAGLLAALWLWRGERRRRQDSERLLLRRTVDEEAAQARAADERGRWLALADATADMILTVDEKMLVVQANREAQETFGSLPPLISLIAYTRSLDLERLVTDARETADPEGLERLLALHDRPHRARALAGGRHVAVALQDVSEVQRLSRARQDLVANLSHELRTPLASLQLLAETLAGRMGEDPQLARRLAGKIVAEVDTLHQMTQEMLDLAAIESGRQMIRLIPVPLNEILAIPLEQMADQAGRRGIRLGLEGPMEIPILADREQAQRAILNVLHNAVKFSPDGGNVLLTSRLEPEQVRVVLSIQDGGPGIAPGDLERIFERFYRADQARGTPGTGLGLAITRHILQAHGGQVWAENRPPPHHGAVFHLAFPTA